jgi:hypothetical protein
MQYHMRSVASILVTFFLTKKNILNTSYLLSITVYRKIYRKGTATIAEFPMR